MLSNTVDQPTALRMKEVGWVKETEKIYIYDEPDHKPGWYLEVAEDTLSNRYYGWLPAPNVCEMGEELKWSDYYQYWWRATDAIIPLAEWLYSIMHDADKLAEIWIWSTSNKKGELGGKP